MKLHTEKEIFTENQRHAFKLRQLYLNKKGQFDQIADYLPFSMHINSRKSLQISYINLAADNMGGQEMRDIVTKGLSFLRGISCPNFLNYSYRKIKLFNQYNDPLSICSYMQYIRFNGKMTFYYANKMILDDENYLNIGMTLKELGQAGTFIGNVLADFTYEKNGWEKFLSLTPQEKNIMIMLASGKSNQEIAEQLFISHHTVRTHRKQINKKLDIKHFRDLVRFAQACELL